MENQSFLADFTFWSPESKPKLGIFGKKGGKKGAKNTLFAKSVKTGLFRPFLALFRHFYA